MHRMIGDLQIQGKTLSRAGFFHPAVGPAGGFEVGPSIPLFTRGAGLSQQAQEFLGSLERTEVVGDLNQIAFQLGATLKELQRGISTGVTAFPVRENLEAEAKVLVPLDTPVRNMLPRRMGHGTASAWKQITSLGGGWGTSLDQPGGLSTIRSFFSETIAGSQSPAEHTTVYADKSASYKLMGTYGSLTGFAMAAGANFQNQMAIEKANAIRNLMLNEEYALIAGDSSSTSAPWGDGTNALAFDGLINLISTANGTPSDNVQGPTVGPLTMSHIDNQLRRLWNEGAQNPWILMNGTEILSLVHLAQAEGSIIRVQATSSADSILGLSVSGIKHPITGEIVPVMASRFMPQGTILFGSKYLPDGSPSADVEVLPQVQLPELAPTEMVQGYVAQELAPTHAAPQVYAFIVTVYEVLRMKSARHFAKSTGVTAV